MLDVPNAMDCSVKGILASAMVTFAAREAVFGVAIRARTNYFRSSARGMCAPRSLCEPDP